MNFVFLIGMMGSGKSTTAKELASLCNSTVVDIDKQIEEKTGKSINQIFTEEGEERFREIEKDTLSEFVRFSSSFKTVVSPNNLPFIVGTSGGLVLRPENVKTMIQAGKIIYLKTSFETLWDRVKNSKHRPLLKKGNPKEALRTIFNERTVLYEQTTPYSVETDGKTPREVAIEINEKFLKS